MKSIQPSRSRLFLIELQAAKPGCTLSKFSHCYENYNSDLTATCRNKEISGQSQQVNQISGAPCILLNVYGRWAMTILTTAHWFIAEMCDESVPHLSLCGRKNTLSFCIFLCFYENGKMNLKGRKERENILIAYIY